MGRTSREMKMLHRKNQRKERLKIKKAILEGKKHKRRGGTSSAKKAEPAGTAKKDTGN